MLIKNKTKEICRLSNSILFYFSLLIALVNKQVEINREGDTLALNILSFESRLCYARFENKILNNILKYIVLFNTYVYLKINCYL